MQSLSVQTNVERLAQIVIFCGISINSKKYKSSEGAITLLYWLKIAPFWYIFKIHCCWALTVTRLLYWSIFLDTYTDFLLNASLLRSTLPNIPTLLFNGNAVLFAILDEDFVHKCRNDVKYIAYIDVVVGGGIKMAVEEARASAGSALSHAQLRAPIGYHRPRTLDPDTIWHWQLQGLPSPPLQDYRET